MYLIAGLGNPGDKFVHTRHNLGFEVINMLVHKLGMQNKWSQEEKFISKIIKINETTPKLILAKPTTFMNRSGLAVSKIAQYYKIKPEQIIVIHDELDLVLGHIKVKLGGSGGGHHGTESVIKQLGSDKFIRVRLGIGNMESLSGEHKHRSFNAEHFVVENFLPNEKSKVKAMIKRAVKAIEIILEDGIEKAQNQFN